MSSRLVAALALFITFSSTPPRWRRHRPLSLGRQNNRQNCFLRTAPAVGHLKSVAIKRGGNADDEPQLPYATRQAKEKFPVTLYTSANCVSIPRKLARNFLNRRGIPFAEKMLNTEEDIAELSKRLGSEASTPEHHCRGTKLADLRRAMNNLLDLAGYPSSAPLRRHKSSGAFAK